MGIAGYGLDDIQGPGLMGATTKCTPRSGNCTNRVTAENREGTVLRTPGCIVAPPFPSFLPAVSSFLAPCDGVI